MTPARGRLATWPPTPSGEALPVSLVPFRPPAGGGKPSHGANLAGRVTFNQRIVIGHWNLVASIIVNSTQP